MKIFRDIFCNGVMNSISNEINICFYSNSSRSNRMLDDRPISLVSSLFKIISKVLVSGLSRALSKTFGPSQGIFVQDRQIVYLTLILKEVVQDCRRKKRSVSLNLDFAKAYNYKQYGFLIHVIINRLLYSFPSLPSILMFPFCGIYIALGISLLEKKWELDRARIFVNSSDRFVQSLEALGIFSYKSFFASLIDHASLPSSIFLQLLKSSRPCVIWLFGVSQSDRYLWCVVGYLAIAYDVATPLLHSLSIGW